ncbi:CDP-diacylglycerol--glycerol-3-phosphate 3-phosphatidyltransferase, mitochondrial [Onthophagus taurus]|uniref:CDP-diacylglycerol--glycerol-3-phosphate 3-phosphatidyltransferase, mitochondrial n=1 Tax=Onthophagus taurus TaxID=166361 RepID=UPI000C2067A6|nr:CDP-diacylglycerol--glycerol-3-phosphate 3-phosphatidyltransferase, mitochondrial [Onthophagus taurus]
MFRRVLSTVMEGTVNPHYEPLAYTSPFTHQDLLHLQWLNGIAPCFPVKAKNISIIAEPCQFYNTIIEKCAKATKRITLVSLYLGNGNLETNLVNALMSNTSFINGQLDINVLLDYTRGSRFKNNSRTMLLPLLNKNDRNCQISLYHTPILRGLRKKLAPNRWNELFGLQHMKLYIFDDTLIISGANLSKDYFTNRQDRYFVIENKNICDFYCGLVKCVQAFSLKLDKLNNIGLNTGWTQLPYEGSKNKFIQQAGALIQKFLNDTKEEQNYQLKNGYDTWVYPLVQMGQLGVKQDAFVTECLLANAPTSTKLYIATGYFNLTHRYMQTIIYNSNAQCKLLMAHPNANGFKGAKGPAGGIPDAYSLLAQKFRKKLEKLGQNDRVTFQEYLRQGWTYHAKGLWYYTENSRYPSLTLIGSPNFGERSVKRDLETQIAIITENEELKKEMHNECQRLYGLGLPVTEYRIIPKWVYAMVFLFRGYF